MFVDGIEHGLPDIPVGGQIFVSLGLLKRIGGGIALEKSGRECCSLRYVLCNANAGNESSASPPAVDPVGWMAI